MKKGRRLWFYPLMILIPVMVLLLMEVLLRVFNLFPRPPLFIETVKEGVQVIQLNSDVGKRYFNAKRVAVPNLYPETFAVKKSPATFRIFCLGGSTTAGFPFDYQVPFPFQLKILLSRYYPGRSFEVINLGLSAISSYTVLDFMPEVLDREPDLIILYMGHNEFYGAYGSASAISMGQNGSIIRFYLQVQRLRLAQMVRQLLFSLTPAIVQDPHNTTLMEQVIADKRVPLDSDKYRTTLANFRTNLSLILDQCRNAGTPALIGTLFSNDRDLPPFGSVSRGDIDKPLSKELAEMIRHADDLLRQEQFISALPVAQKIVEKDSISAAAWFRLAKIDLALGDSLNAEKYYTEARNRDVVRFRASDDLNKIIRQAAAAEGALCVDLKEWMESRSPFHIIGHELICDHLHPNPIGYFWMAAGFADQIIKENRIGARDANFSPSQPAFITDLDWDMGLLSVYKLVHRWPFANEQVNYDHYPAHGDPQAARIAYDYLFNHHNWVKAHYAMAEYYLKANHLEKARREYEPVIAFFPEQPDPLLRMAGICEQQGDWNDAEAFLQQALSQAKQKGMIYYRLAAAQWRLKKMAAAVKNIQMAIVAPDLTPRQRTAAKYDLATYFIEANRKEYAIRVLQDILGSEPDNQAARELLNKTAGDQQDKTP